MKAAIAGLSFMAAMMCLVILAAVGWVKNIVAIIPLLSGDITAMLVARIVGVPVAPLGAILGWFA
jgi:hypothetical protein